MPQRRSFIPSHVRVRAADPRQLAVTLLMAGAGAAIAVPRLDPDAVTDLLVRIASFARWAVSATAVLTLPVLAALAIISALHYVAAAGASRAAAGVPLPFPQLLATQLAASAANRLTPAGIGGAGVLARFLCRRGGLTKTEAAAAISALAVLGALADLAAFGLLIGAGLLFGAAGAGSEVPLLLSRLTSFVSIPTGWWLVVVPPAVGAGAVAATRRMRASRIGSRLRGAIRPYAAALAQMARSPARLTVLMVSSAATTLTLSAGFALACVVGPVGLAPAKAGALMIGYVLGSAAGNALPTPGGVGAADVALVGVLLTSGAATPPAIATVLAFRLVTFWAPAAIGVLLLRPLRRAGAL